ELPKCFLFGLLFEPWLAFRAIGFGIPSILVVVSNADDLETLVGVIIVPLLQVGERGNARPTPYGKEVEQDHLTLKRLGSLLLAIHPRLHVLRIDSVLTDQRVHPDGLLN